uniref:Reverse transcriptase domain-containing protein n=1 Tax=Tanacetum cinerariifolium TaxID=118510 RepID=A0A6L2LGW5_TANCI|nr:reverse transcriptase domain-containing protein [Tanacetum cinerariifolium]
MGVSKMKRSLGEEAALNTRIAKYGLSKWNAGASQGIFRYTKMPFGLRNAGATYQRLVDKAFHKQIGRNLKVDVDDLVIKSRMEDEIVRDIKDTVKTLMEINMKVNPKKCTFGVEEGMFSGYTVNTKGLKVCPDKGIKRSGDKLYINRDISVGLGTCQQVPKEILSSTPNHSSYGLADTAEEEGDTWMTHIFEFLTEEILPADVKEARAVRHKSQRFVVINEILYKKIFPRTMVTVRRATSSKLCHERDTRTILSMHAGTRSVVAKALRIGYYWPTMHKDARTLIRACQDCQVHKPVPRNPQQ